MSDAARRARDLGQSGEDAASEALRARGFAVLARNVRMQDGELDLIAEDVAGLVFVEVKTRSGTEYGPPWRAVDARKRRVMERAAREWMERERRTGACWRFGIISVVAERDGRVRSLDWIDEACQ